MRPTVLRLSERRRGSDPEPDGRESQALLLKVDKPCQVVDVRKLEAVLVKGGSEREVRGGEQG